MKSYLLDDRVRFIPSTSSLYRIEANGEPSVVTLNTPAGRCLHLLLSKQTLTTQQELYAFAWDDQGAQVTPNNLYQNMSLIRKALATSFEKEGEYIITVPRQGFYINPAIAIQEQDIESEQSITAPPFNRKQKTGSLWLAYYAMLLCILLVTIAVDIFYYYQYSNKPSFLSSYVEIANSDGCRFYGNAELDNPERRKEIVDTMQWACIRGKHNYITGYDFPSPYSIISCPEKVTTSSPSQCSSLLILDKNSQ